MNSSRKTKPTGPDGSNKGLGQGGGGLSKSSSGNAGDVGVMVPHSNTTIQEYHNTQLSVPLTYVDEDLLAKCGFYRFDLTYAMEMQALEEKRVEHTGRMLLEKREAATGTGESKRQMSKFTMCGSALIMATGPNQKLPKSCSVQSRNRLKRAGPVSSQFLPKKLLIQH